MFNTIKATFVYLIFLCTFLIGCTSDDQDDKTPPTVTLSTPADGAVSVDTKSSVTIQFSEKIVLSGSIKILLNDQAVAATVSDKALIINTTLLAGTSYTLYLPKGSVSDVSGNNAEAITIKFTTAGSILPSNDLYEAEKATLSGDAAVSTSQSGFSGTGYVNTNTGNVAFNIQVSETGYYDVYLRYVASGQKVNSLYIDGVQSAEITFAITSVWAELKAAKLKLTAGAHTISIVKSWGYIQLDYLKLTRDANGPVAFNIASAPVTPNPSTQLANLYNFLKTNFGTKIISGTMANYSTNITEATWVYNNTGKWPALTGFDFIDHTNPNQNWVNYSGPFTLGKEWWNNNGIVAMTWHWRNPLTKSGDFYTDKTTFDISKVTDVNSAEYKAMIVDIDVIAGYLKQFKDANIPVIWRPLHEAEGGWFWWGAKGAEPCKTLWKLLFDRLVNYHGLNNLIWVWTSSASVNAANWYPGDNYVDVVGMDIYPGEKQHGSQYISFNVVREMTNGKKIITLSECGSTPDPALMLEQGDTWSWFMPWNGDYTESDLHNGVTWWKKFFNYDYVITRDKMPSLK